MVRTRSIVRIKAGFWILAVLMTALAWTKPSLAREANHTGNVELPLEKEEKEDTGFQEFQYWNENAPALEAVLDFVKNAEDEEGEGYIPPQDRAAVFALDGTLYADRFPASLEEYLFAWRVLKDPDFEPDANMLSVARTLRDDIESAVGTPGDDKESAAGASGDDIKGAAGASIDDPGTDLSAEVSEQAARAYAGMSLTEYEDYISQILQRDADGFTGMTYRQAFYLPMLELISYLQEHEFQVYVCSESDRFLCRVLLDGVIDIPVGNIIGSDVELDCAGENEDKTDDSGYDRGDEIIRTDKLLSADRKMNSLSRIVREIGHRPVLAFGSSRDTDILNYTLSGKSYPCAAFMLAADDDDRDYARMQTGREKEWEKAGYQIISMKGDFSTLYGEQVKKTGSFQWGEQLEDDRAGWHVTADPAGQESMETAARVVDTATADIWDILYTPLMYLGYTLGENVGDGTTHSVLCKASFGRPWTKPCYLIMNVYEDLEGNLKIFSYDDLDIMHLADVGVCAGAYADEDRKAAAEDEAGEEKTEREAEAETEEVTEESAEEETTEEGPTEEGTEEAITKEETEEAAEEAIREEETEEAAEEAIAEEGTEEAAEEAITEEETEEAAEGTLTEEETEEPTEEEITEQGTKEAETLPESGTKQPSCRVRLDVENILQMPDLPTGCESVSLTIALRYFGYPASKFEIARKYLPKQDFYEDDDRQLYGADFHDTFAGDPEDSASYGCYAPCIVTTANNYLKDKGYEGRAYDLTGTDFENLLTDYIDQGIPLPIWITNHGLEETRLTTTWKTDKGKSVQWVAPEHCVVLTGYDTKLGLVYASDPIFGNIEYDYDTFRERYNELGMQAVYIDAADF